MARAQIVDPTTGVMVDAATDPMDFSAIMSGQPTNIGLEMALSANVAAQDAANASMAAAGASSPALADTSSPALADAGDDSAATPMVPALPSTPKPVITPNGGSFKSSVQVTIADSDAAAVMFYTTNGKRPTTSSQRYAGPIVVTGKTKVEALAFDVNMQPSGVVSKTFKVK